MKIVKLIALVLLILMSLAAGAAKIMQTPQEAGFFDAIGVSLAFLVPFGLLQVIGAILAAIPKTRRLGAAVMALAFLISAVMIFLSGNMMFGFISLIPAIVAGALGLTRWTTHETL